jgi:hypothetical protein
MEEKAKERSMGTVMNYGELDNVTRKAMLAEFEAEENSGQPYRSKAVSEEGLKAFPMLMRSAIESGDEGSLGDALNDPGYWLPTEEYVRSGVTRERQRNIRQAAERLALTEFSTWYVRGLARRLLNEGIPKCQVYRAAEPKWVPGTCAEHEGLVVDIQVVYDGHRAKYWPEPGNPDAFSIPFGPGCHHVIRRVVE